MQSTVVLWWIPCANHVVREQSIYGRKDPNISNIYLVCFLMLIETHILMMDKITFVKVVRT